MLGDPWPVDCGNSPLVSLCTLRDGCVEQNRCTYAGCSSEHDWLPALELEVEDGAPRHWLICCSFQLAPNAAVAVRSLASVPSFRWSHT